MTTQLLLRSGRRPDMPALLAEVSMRGPLLCILVGVSGVGAGCSCGAPIETRAPRRSDTIVSLGPATAGLGHRCNGPKQCLTGHCVRYSAADSACTVTCDGDWACPEEWSCRPIAGSTPFCIPGPAFRPGPITVRAFRGGPMPQVAPRALAETASSDGGLGLTHPSTGDGGLGQ